MKPMSHSGFVRALQRTYCRQSAAVVWRDYGTTGEARVTYEKATQLSLSLCGDAATPPGIASALAGDRLATPSAKPIAGFSTKRDLYNRWRRCRARYRKAQRSHHGQRAAHKAFVLATAAWLRA